ncbi:unnamed protein product [Bacillus thuringiensis DB27]|uniref:Uncharacterized protein n=1 Tax=Bacillus thuringiensis DB27 TaxID=1431339 RepID=W8YE28_BACTU|nr:unnamed protein product [Bacillus thuringiensis DB27]
MKTRVHYPEETKWKVIEMKKTVIQIVQLWRNSELKMFPKLRHG